MPGRVVRVHELGARQRREQADQPVGVRGRRGRARPSSATSGRSARRNGPGASRCSISSPATSTSTGFEPRCRDRLLATGRRPRGPRSREPRAHSTPSADESTPTRLRATWCEAGVQPDALLELLLERARRRSRDAAPSARARASISARCRSSGPSPWKRVERVRSGSAGSTDGRAEGACLEPAHLALDGGAQLRRALEPVATRGATRARPRATPRPVTAAVIQP